MYKSTIILGLATLAVSASAAESNGNGSEPVKYYQQVRNGGAYPYDQELHGEGCSDTNPYGHCPKKGEETTMNCGYGNDNDFAYFLKTGVNYCVAPEDAVCKQCYDHFYKDFRHTCVFESHDPVGCYKRK